MKRYVIKREGAAAAPARLLLLAGIPAFVVWALAAL